jgi:hypothetical protein
VLPRELQGNFGPQLTALVAYLTVVCRMPRRVVEAFLEQVLGVEMSLGSTQKCWEEASQAVALPCQELEEQLKDEPVLNVDETGWRSNGDKRYLWAFVAWRFVVYTVATSRGSEVLVRLHMPDYFASGTSFAAARSIASNYWSMPFPFKNESSLWPSNT